MKKITTILLVLAISVTPMYVMAASDDSHGADAHSSSMSAGSGSENSDNQNIDEEPGVSSDGSEDELETTDDSDVTDEVEIEVEDATEEDIAAEETAQREAEKSPIVHTVVIIGVVLAALATGIRLLKRGRKDIKRK